MKRELSSIVPSYSYQSAEGKSKRKQLESNSLIRTDDSFKKIVIVKEDINNYTLHH